jgi:integrase
MPNACRFMTLFEVLEVLKDLRRGSRRSISKRLDLIVFRLSCCCGLRRSEISGLLLGDLMLSGTRPGITIRKENTKGQEGKKRQRFVPLFWDKNTLSDIQAWATWRADNGAQPSDHVVCGVSHITAGKQLSGQLLSKRWRTAIRCLGKERIRQLSVHSGRHSFASLSLEAGRSLAEVRDALGHKNIMTTSIYLHCLSRDVPDVFAASQTGGDRHGHAQRA